MTSPNSLNARIAAKDARAERHIQGYQRTQNRLDEGADLDYVIEDRRAFADYFIGALAGEVTDATWVMALDVAHQCVHEQRARREARR